MANFAACGAIEEGYGSKSGLMLVFKRNQSDKVVKHSNGFKVLLEHSFKQGIITESAYEILLWETKTLMNQ